MNRSLLALTILAALTITACKPKDDTAATADTATPAADTTTPAAETPATTPDTPTTEPTPVGGTATPNTPPVGQASPAPEGGARLSSGDDLALGLLGAIDANEIAAAKQAQEKNVTGAVLDYAKMMEKEHTANLDKAKSLGTLGETPDVKDIKDKGAAELSTLGQKSGKGYAAAYIDAMIAGHKDALATLDGKIMSAASTDPVKQFLTETKTHVQQHLEKAEAIKKAM